MYKYLILFFWSFLAATFFPVSSEVYMAEMIRSGNHAGLMSIVLVATAGNVLGGLVTFYMGWKGGELAARKMSEKNRKRYEKAEKAIKKWGVYSMALSWVPFVGDVIVLLGGAFKLPPLQSAFWLAVGKFLRYLVFAFSVAGILDKFLN